jgi:hypothetical protein
MLWLIATFFLLIYMAIVLEEWLQWDRTLLSLGGAVLLWGLYASTQPTLSETLKTFENSAEKTSQIVLFLLAVMILVEWIRENGGFVLLQKWLLHDSALQELWRITWVTFFLSAVIDNMTSTLVMLAIIKARHLERDRQWTLVSMVVLASNAGGAWSPIGDVTTTMLWIAGMVSPLGLIQGGFVAAVLNCLLPLLLCTRLFMGSRASQMRSLLPTSDSSLVVHGGFQHLVLSMGLVLMLMIPVLAHLTNWPPAMVAVLCLLALAGVVDPWLSKAKSPGPTQVAVKSHTRLISAFFKIDWPSIVFILGILLCMDLLQEAGVLSHLSKFMHDYLGQEFNQIFALGLLSAFLDNIPLVSASMNMFSLSVYPLDNGLWLLLAYCAGTGGSLLILGSAAGIVAMGQEGLKFAWYLKNFTFKALVGYVGGAGVFWLMR